MSTPTPTFGAPKVSCLMVTSFAPERRYFLARSLESYDRQTHANRELVVVPDCDERQQAALAELVGSRGRVVPLADAGGRRSLGELRNLSLEQAAGELVCQWDDDDLYHPYRIERQAAALAGGAQASLLGCHFGYFEQERRMVVLDWRGSLMRGHPGTLLMPRNLGLRYPVAGPTSRRSEDTSLFQQLLRRRVGVAVVEAWPELYVYRFHGANTWTREHQRGLVTRHGRRRAELVADAARLSSGLGEVFLERESVDVDGCDGAAFTARLERSQPRQDGGTPAAESVA